MEVAVPRTGSISMLGNLETTEGLKGLDWLTMEREDEQDDRHSPCVFLFDGEIL